MRTKNGFANDTDFVHRDFISKNPEISIPYLIVTSVSALIGCFGNAMVIGSVIVYKVRSGYDLNKGTSRINIRAEIL